ncbi:MAG: hypothetical protein WA110_05270 [Anaerolineaceae bacterium]
MPAPATVQATLVSPTDSGAGEEPVIQENFPLTILLEAVSADAVPGEDEMLATIFTCTASTPCRPIIHYGLEKMHGFHLAPSGRHLVADLRMSDGSVQLFLIDLQTAAVGQLTNSKHIHYILGWEADGTGFLVNQHRLDTIESVNEPDSLLQFDLVTQTNQRLLESCSEFVNAYYLEDDILFSATCEGQTGIFRFSPANGQVRLLVEATRPQFELSPMGDELAFNRTGEDGVSQVLIFNLTNSQLETAPHMEGFKDIGGGWVDKDAKLVSFTSTREGQPGFSYIWDRTKNIVRHMTTEEQGYIVDIRWKFDFDGNKALLTDLEGSFKPISVSIPESYRIENAAVGYIPYFAAKEPIAVP